MAAKLVQLSHQMFPAIEADEDEPADEGYSAINFWRPPLPPLPLPDTDTVARAATPVPPAAAIAAPPAEDDSAPPKPSMHSILDAPSVDGMDE